MKSFLFIACALSMIGLSYGQLITCPRNPTVANFSLSAFSGQWYVYQLALKNSQPNSGAFSDVFLCNHYNFLNLGNNVNMVQNYTYFSYQQNQFKSNSSILTYNATQKSGLLRQVINPPTSTSVPESGDIELSVLLTDYTTYAFLVECQMVNFQSSYEENVILLVRSLTSPEINILPILGNVFQSFRNLTARGYRGGMMEYVRHDRTVCAGL